MSDVGIFLGGALDEIDRRKGRELQAVELGLGQQRLDLAGQEIANAETAAIAASVQSNMDQLVSNFVDMRSQFNGTSEEWEAQLGATVRAGMTQVGDFAEQAGLDRDHYESLFLMKINSVPTALEAAQTESVTLSPGQRRVMGETVIAEGGPGPGFRLLTVDEIASRGLPDGTVVQVNEESNEVKILFSPSADQNNMDARIANLVSRGYHPDLANDIARGNVELVISDALGVARLINKLTNTVTEIPLQSLMNGGLPEGYVPQGANQSGGQPLVSEEVVVDTTPDGSLTILSDVSRFGGEAVVGEAIQKFSFGLIGDNEERNRQRQRYRLLREILVDAWSRSSRPSDFAQKRIEELLPSQGVFESAAGAYDKLVTVREHILSDLDYDEAIAGDPNMPQKERTEARGRIISANRALAMIGDPAKSPRPGESEGDDYIPPKERREVGRVYKLPNGYAVWNRDGWTPITGALVQ